MEGFREFLNPSFRKTLLNDDWKWIPGHSDICFSGANVTVNRKARQPSVGLCSNTLGLQVLTWAAGSPARDE